MSDGKFVPIEVEQIPRDANGNVEMDLYVHLPGANRFICFVVKGDELSPRKLASLKGHVEPRLFVPAGQAHPTAQPTESLKEGTRIDATTMVDDYKKIFAGDGIPLDKLRVEVVSQETQAELRELYKAILDPNAPDIPTIANKLNTMADEIINVVAPEVKDIKAHLIRNTKYLRVMNDASAISSLAVLFGLANGFDSQRSYRELAFATLVMDVGLSEFDDTTIHTYYTSPETLDSATLQRLKNHPLKSHQLAIDKLKSVTEVTKQLILTHHELHNGKGYPRGLRTDSIFPIARVLALAVDVFEALKRDELGAQQGTTIQDVLKTFISADIEAHSRRHNTKVVQTTLRFLGLEDTPATQAP